MSDHIAEVSKKGDLISRQALLRQIDIDSDGEPGYYGDTWKFFDTIKMMPSAQPEPEDEEFEWCTDCKEYDQTAHCCHRFTKVIRQTVEEIKAEQPQPKTGKWIEHNPHKFGLGIIFECSECGEKIECEEYNYCPNCGAKMKEGEAE